MENKIDCKHCDEIIDTDNYKILLDGTRLHIDCFSFIEYPGRKYDRECELLDESIQEKKSEIRRELNSRSLLQKLFLVKTDRCIKLIDIYNRLRSEYNELLSEASDFKYKKWKEYKEYYDYWPERPPDWKTRSRLLRKRVNKCEKCKREPTKKRKLHAHHIIPISDGGNHLETNLRVLCNYCHKKEHKHKFRRNFYANNKDLQSTLDKVEKAIKSDGILNFQYDTGHKSLQYYSIVPINITYLNGVSVRGIDNELGSKRVFSLKRMRFIDPHTKSSRKDNFHLLRKALNQDSLIHCIYTNFEGSKSERTLRPINFTEFNNTKVINCYDYLREAQRSFNPSRMKNIKFVDKPGLQRRLD